MTEQATDPFRTAFKGRFENVLRWEQLDALWTVLRDDADGDWYIDFNGTPIKVPGDIFGDAVAIDNGIIAVGAQNERSGNGDPENNQTHRVGAAYVWQ